MESCVINRIRRHLLFVGYIFQWKAHVINRIRRHLLLLAIFSNGKLCNKILEDIYCRWLYFPMESCVINHVRRYILSLAIFSIGNSM